MKHTPEIFISYAWEKQPDGNNWPPILQHLYKSIIEKGYKVKIDVKSINYKDSIKSFMQNIGNGNYIIVLISDKYMRSKNCMYEVLQILKYPNYRDRIFPILIEDAKLYDTRKIIEYIKYWDSEIVFLNKEAKSLSNIAYAAPIFEDIEIMNEIRRIIANFSGQIGDMNVLNINTHKDSDFQELIESIDRKIEIDKDNLDIKSQNTILLKKVEELSAELEDLKLKYSNMILELNSKEDEIENLKAVKYSLIMKNSEPEILPDKVNIDLLAFRNFLGFSKNTHKEEVIKLLGLPTENDEGELDKYDFNNMYYDDIMTFSYLKDSKKLMAIDIENGTNSYSKTIKKIKAKGITDEKINFLGKSKDEILKTFGTPSRISHGNYNYNFEDFTVNFICYENDRNKCSSIQVQFFY